MEKIIINTGDHISTVLIGKKWKSFVNYTPEENVVIITDDNLQKLYGNLFPDFPVLSVTPGEKSKKLDTINELAAKLLDLGIDRKGFIVGIGGGVVCDIVGFLGSVYMRGIEFGFISTSLLSQVDAGVGGKNGVNVGSVKNILGTFNQPEFVICDQEMLISLPDDEYLSGLAELIKTGVILDENLIEMIEKNAQLIFKRDYALLEKLILRAVELKAAVVREDEKESGRRMILNFGHTFGHAIEAHSGMKHGFAVASGMILSADISVETGILQPVARDRLFRLLKSFNLLPEFSINAIEMNELILHDKKRSGDKVSFVLLEEFGRAIVQKINIEKLMDYYGKINTGK